MERETFQSTLLEKAKAANNNAPIDNLSERTISEIVGMFLPQFADDEKITDESWNLPVQTIRTLSGQLRHDTSTGINDFKTKFEAEQKTAQQKAIDDAVAAFKAQWEKDHPTQEPPKKDDDNTEPDIAKLVEEKVAEQMQSLTGEGSEFGKLSKQFSDYLKAQAERDKTANENSIRRQVRDYLIGRGVEEEDFALDYTLEKMAIGENPDVEALKTKAEKDYEANYKKIHKNDGSPVFRGGGGGQETISPLIKSHIDRVAKEAKDAEDYANSIEFAK